MTICAEFYGRDYTTCTRGNGCVCRKEREPDVFMAYSEDTPAELVNFMDPTGALRRAGLLKVRK